MRTYQAKQQKEATSVWVGRGGRVCYDFELDNYDFQRATGMFRTNARPPGPNCLREIVGIDYLADVVIAIADRSEMSDKFLAVLKHFRHLREVSVDVDSGEGLAHLGSMNNLLALFISSENIVDADISHIRRLTNLRRLGLYVPIGDEGLCHLSQMTELRQLSLLSSRISDSGVDHILVLKNLTKLDIRHTLITAAGIERLRAELPGCHIVR